MDGGEEFDGAKSIAAHADGSRTVMRTINRPDSSQDITVCRHDSRRSFVVYLLSRTALARGSRISASERRSPRPQSDGDSDVLVLHCDLDGGLLWERKLRGVGHESSDALVVHTDGSFVIAATKDLKRDRDLQ